MTSIVTAQAIENGTHNGTSTQDTRNSVSKLKLSILQAVAHMMRLPIPYLNSFALAYTGSRVLYNIVYY
jgi:hypothetical protein